MNTVNNRITTTTKAKIMAKVMELCLCECEAFEIFVEVVRMFPNDVLPDKFAMVFSWITSAKGAWTNPTEDQARIEQLNKKIDRYDVQAHQLLVVGKTMYLQLKAERDRLKAKSTDTKVTSFQDVLDAMGTCVADGAVERRN